MDKTFEQIWEEATKAAERDAVYKTVELGGLNCMDSCGGAYILVRPARGPFITWCKKNGIGERGVHGGWEITCPYSPNTQSVTIREAASRAFAQVLKAHGITAYMKSYLS